MAADLYHPDVIQPLLTGFMVIMSLLQLVQRLGRLPSVGVVIFGLTAAAYPQIHSASVVTGAWH
ncbi:MAG: hypothetical protein ACR2RA_26490 [Geminicoccaceae bacterium]